MRAGNLVCVVVAVVVVGVAFFRECSLFMMEVDGSGIFNLGKGLRSGDCRTGSGGLRTGGEACCETGLGLPVAAYQPAVTTSVHSQSYTPPIFKGPLCSSPPSTH